MSSRSHHVFQIRIQTFDKLGKACQSFLNIVDLAGSERRPIGGYEAQEELNKKKSSRLLSDKRCSYASVIAGANNSRNIDLSLT